MAHITLPDRPDGLLRRLAWWYSRRRFGQVVDPVRAAARHPGVLMAMGTLEMVAGRGWRRLDPHLRSLAEQAVAGRIGCSWCMDFGYYEGIQQGVDARKVRDVPRWRESDAYDERERSVLEFAEAATAAPAEIPAELVSRLHGLLSDEEITELAAWVALENLRSRFNAGLGLTSQGFAERCEVRPAARAG
jgi:alkylhydroperoxidase family enzyme